jgi:type I restriction-modification system DNA methylase subunit
MAFSTRWQGTTYEKGESQTFWNEFLSVFGVDRKRVAYFEQRAKRSSASGYGFIDLFWPGMLLVEQKSAGKDLLIAESQADEYLQQLSNGEFPVASIVSDFARIKVTWYDGKEKGETSIVKLEDLAQVVEKFSFLAGFEVKDYSQQDHVEVNGKAASLMVELYKEVTGDHFPQEEASTFLTRILFLLFGDDSGLWSKGLFYQLVSESSTDGSDLSGKLTTLFQTLDKVVEERSSKLEDVISQFPYVNGHIFEDPIEVPQFDSRMRAALIECSEFDWSRVSPDIFGSLFQEVKDRADRREDGEHYTSPENIQKVLGPLFLEDLKAELQACGKSVTRLQEFRKKLGSFQFLDPACGCGNFLVLAYKEMRSLELEALSKIREIEGKDVLANFDMTDFLFVRLSSFHGIELHEWPAKIARTALFLSDHQANVELSKVFGRAPARLPISDGADIRIGNALHMSWDEIISGHNVVILGNPPFVGMDKMSTSQQADRNAVFGEIGFSSSDRTGRLDYVSSWFAKGISFLEKSPARIAFVATNSLFQGDQARALEGVFESKRVSISFAHRTFRWSSGGKGKAAVYCAIVGFGSGFTGRKFELFDYDSPTGVPYLRIAKQISTYLIDCELPGPKKLGRPLNLAVPNLVKGSQPTDGGALLVEESEFAAVEADPICKKYLRPFVRAKSLLQGGRAWCLWLVDATPAELRSSQLLSARLKSVAELRAKSKTQSVRDKAMTPYLFTQIRQPSKPWLAVPRVSSENRSYIPMSYYASDYIAGDTVSFFEDAPLWLFGVLGTKAFTDWVATFSGALEGRFRISPELSLNGFPPLCIDESLKPSLEAEAKRILEIRNEKSTETLSDLYGEYSMPESLVRAHGKLDSIVDKWMELTNPSRLDRSIRMLQLHHKFLDANQLI